MTQHPFNPSLNVSLFNEKVYNPSVTDKPEKCQNADYQKLIRAYMRISLFVQTGAEKGPISTTPEGNVEQALTKSLSAK